MAELTRIYYIDNDGGRTTIFVGPKSKSDAVLDSLQMLIPAIKRRLVIDDKNGFRSLSTGRGDDLLVVRD